MIKRTLFCVVLSMALSVLGLRASAPDPAPVVLVSLDGFRWDYLDKYPEAAPTLRRLRESGVSAQALIPVFPSNTFPNHYTIVTGLRPGRHGMLNNTMFDPVSGTYFRNTVKALVRDPRWWGGEPIWVTAIQQGRRAGTSFWVGSEATIKGVAPTWLRPFDPAVPSSVRLAEVTGWFRLPAMERPSFVGVYFEETNAVGHRVGPDSEEIVGAIRQLDTQLEALLEGLANAGVTPNLVVVSDHGMTTTRREACVVLDDFIDLNDVQLDFTGPVAGLRPTRGSVDECLERLKNLPGGARAYRATELPTALQLKDHVRIPPILVLPGLGGWAEVRARIDAKLPETRGEHGYDPRYPDMHGILIAHGPAFRKDGGRLGAVENIHVYNLLCAVMGLTPAENDGDGRLLAFLADPRE